MSAQENIKNFVRPAPVPNPPANAPVRAANVPPVATSGATPAQAGAKSGTAQPQKPSPAARQAAQVIVQSGTNTSDAVVGAANSVASTVSGFGQGIENWASGLPAPGGILALLAVLFLLLWAVIPVNASGGGHYTRLQLLWYTLTGRTTLGGPAEANQQGLLPGSPFVPGFGGTGTGGNTGTSSSGSGGASGTPLITQVNPTVGAALPSLFSLPEFGGTDFTL